MDPTAARTSLRLEKLTEGQAIPFDGDRVALVDAALAASFAPGDRLIVVQDSGDLLRIPRDVSSLVDRAVSDTLRAFAKLSAVDDAAITAFYDDFARRLEDDAIFDGVRVANAADVVAARAAGRAVGRLELSPKMRTDMIAALRMWRDLPGSRDTVMNVVRHERWSVEERKAPLGVVAFVFEGRPNVFADATGVLRTGNTVVFRIGSDALGTARAIVEHCVAPSMVASGLPVGSVTLVDSPERSAGHALFADRRVALAVARGSGGAVAQLGAIARQSGVPASLHGTGGAWLAFGSDARPSDVAEVVDASLDRKVCNTLDVACVERSRPEILAAVLEGASRAGARRGVVARVHVGPIDLDDVRSASVGAKVELLPEDDDRHMSCEWEWDEVPELSIRLVSGLDETIELFHRHGPRFVFSLLTRIEAELEAVYARVEAPFVGNGFTRWVDGQYALSRPELGLSNWQSGRLFARGGILSGDGVFTVRHVARHDSTDQRR